MKKYLLITPLILLNFFVAKAFAALPIVNPTWQQEILLLITNPSVAYILLMIGIYGLIFEFYHPGFILPGIVGAMSLLLSLYALQLLHVNYTAFTLLVFGILLMVAEVFVTSFGLLGLGGLIAFIVGSVFLLDTQAVAWQIIVVMSILSVVFFFVVIDLTIRSMRKKVVTGREALIGSVGKVIECRHNHIKVRVQGEIWQAHSEQPLTLGEKIRITAVNGLMLTVHPIVKKSKED